MGIVGVELCYMCGYGLCVWYGCVVSVEMCCGNRYACVGVNVYCGCVL